MRDIFSLRFYDEFGNGIIFEDKDGKNRHGIRD
jgi:hypothetical protein